MEKLGERRQGADWSQLFKTIRVFKKVKASLFRRRLSHRIRPPCKWPHALVRKSEPQNLWWLAKWSGGVVTGKTVSEVGAGLRKAYGSEQKNFGWAGGWDKQKSAPQGA